MVWLRKHLAVLVMLTPLALIAACDDGPVEEAGEAAEETAEEAEEAVD